MAAGHGVMTHVQITSRARMLTMFTEPLTAVSAGLVINGQMLQHTRNREFWSQRKVCRGLV